MYPKTKSMGSKMGAVRIFASTFGANIRFDWLAHWLFSNILAVINNKFSNRQSGLFAPSRITNFRVDSKTFLAPAQGFHPRDRKLQTSLDLYWVCKLDWPAYIGCSKSTTNWKFNNQDGKRASANGNFFKN